MDTACFHKKIVKTNDIYFILIYSFDKNIATVTKAFHIYGK